jgi:cytochrome c oxidase subunit 3
VIGFVSYEQQDIRLTGAGSNASYSFLLAIAALHGVHVLGGVIALMVMYIRALSTKSRNYSAVPIDVMGDLLAFCGPALDIFICIF